MMNMMKELVSISKENIDKKIEEHRKMLETLNEQ